VVMYERPGAHRCPAEDFLKEIEKPMRKRFLGQLDALSKQGSEYVNQQRFRSLHGAGKPLWELKEHDHRLYCVRNVVGATIVVILLSGWIKDKEGRTEREDREIEKAQRIYGEFMNEYPGGSI